MPPASAPCMPPPTGIIDYVRVAEQYAALVQEAGGEIQCGRQVQKIVSADGQLVVETASGAIRTRAVINCGGLQCDRIARLAGAEPALQIVPFRGEYYTLAPHKHALVNNLIYPVPDPAFPFLGVHFTRTMSGEREAGPNAVLAFAREGYQWADLVPQELWETLRFPGFRTIARKYWQTGLGEIYRSLHKAAFLRALQRLLPELQAEDLLPGGSGVRAQAISAAGALVDDFVIANSPRAIHVLNAPSPGATASLAIGAAGCEAGRAGVLVGDVAGQGAMFRRVFIGVGSNLGNRRAYYQKAFDLMADLSRTSIVRGSALYESEPIGEAKNWYVNGVVLSWRPG